MAIRKSASELTSAEKSELVAAIKALKASGKYDQYVVRHAQPPLSAIKNSPAFLPWHRKFLHEFELDLQDVSGNPNLGLPYWNWAETANPAANAVWGNDLMGGNGDTSDSGIVKTGPFREGQWTTVNSTGGAAGPLIRQFGVLFPRPADQSEIDAVLQVTTYDSAPWDRSSDPSFRNMLEGWYGASGPGLHNLGHVWVGGSMQTMTSPNDPVYFLHLAFVDKLWAVWQAEDASRGYLPESGGPAGNNLNDEMEATLHGKFTPASTLSIETLGYSYDTASSRIQNYRGLPPIGDSPTGEDKLRISSEVYAIAEAIAYKDLEPPLVVATLGGWGSGKSFVLNLIKQRLTQIRCEKIKNAEEFIYVGHPYMIEFNAWTYAKSNLWASLMQDIFVQLNDQLTVESALLKASGKSAREGGPLYSHIYTTNSACLKPLLDSEVGSEAFEKWVKSGGDNTLWKNIRQLQGTDIKELDKKEKELENNQSKVKEKSVELQRRYDKKIVIAIREQALQDAINESKENIKDTTISILKEKFPKYESDWKPAWSELLSEWSGWKDIWLKLGQSKLKASILIGSVILLVPATGWLSKQLWTWISAATPDEWVSYVSSIGVTLTGVWKFVHNWIVKFRELVVQAQGKMSKSKEKVLVELAPEMKREISKDIGLDELTEKSRKITNDVRHLRERIGPVAEFENVRDFVNSRLDEKAYEKELGLLHQVQKDLMALSSSLIVSENDICEIHKDEKAKFFPRGKPRIFLIIDDIDRCPPKRVIEVLEAAQLLVKNELFVVILAMDVRYVTRSLEKFYQDILVRDGEPSGLDYIEKIVQIPYRVRPIDPDSLSGYFQDQMKISQKKDETVTVAGRDQEPISTSVAGKSTQTPGSAKKTQGKPAAKIKVKLEPLPMKTLEFDKHELEILNSCCRIVDITPRSAKRLLNVFKLFKMIWNRRSTKEPKRNIKRAMIFLLTLSACFPEVMRYVLRELADCKRHSHRKRSANTNLGTFISSICRRVSKMDNLKYQCDRIRDIVADTSTNLSTLKLSAIKLSDVELVGSFSFVGEIDTHITRKSTSRP